METSEQVINEESLSTVLEYLEEPKTTIDQLYDAAMRRWAEHNLADVAAWLDPGVASLPAQAFKQQAATFALPTVTADLVTTAGKNRLMHIEYETSPRKSLVIRMFNYRARIMTLNPQVRLTQYVIVLGNGRVRGHDDVSNGFILDLRVIYVRERDPSEFLTNPALAPLAVLARGRRKTRERSFGAALRLIRDSAHPRTSDLIQIAETLALIRLDRSTIDRIRKENRMSIQPLVDHYRTTEVGQYLEHLGWEEGHKEGRKETQRRLLLTALQARFGTDRRTEAVAQRLADWPDVVAMKTVLDASDINTLLSAEPPVTDS